MSATQSRSGLKPPHPYVHPWQRRFNQAYGHTGTTQGHVCTHRQPELQDTRQLGSPNTALQGT